MKLETRNLKLEILTLCLLTSVLCPLSSRSATNVFLDVTGAELNRRINVITNLEESVSNNTATITATTNTSYSAGLADVGFIDVDVSTNFNNSTYTEIDLSEWIGTNSAVVLLWAHDLSGSANDVFFRAPDGGVLGDLDGCSVAQIDANDRAYFIVLTGGSGIIDCKTDGAIEIKLRAFIRRHVFE